MNSGGYIADSKRRGIFLAPWTDPEGDNCFSCIKIKKELFVNKRRHFVRVCLSFQLTAFRGSFLMILLQIQREKFFLQTSKHRQAKFCLFLGICWLSCFIYAKILSFETVSKQEAIWNPVLKQWISRDIPTYVSQSERAKIAIHWLGEHWLKMSVR